MNIPVQTRHPEPEHANGDEIGQIPKGRGPDAFVYVADSSGHPGLHSGPEGVKYRSEALELPFQRGNAGLDL